MQASQRVLVVAILASLVSFLDASVINVALPAITHDLGGGLATQQWVVDAYMITVGSLMLVAGSLSDLFGHRRVLQAGLIGFGITSVLCAVSPTATFLIIARALQGIAGALLVPSSLALIIANFHGPQQSKAIGTWTAWTGIAFLIGPLLGGALVDVGSWRYIFAINVPLILATLWLLLPVAESKLPPHARVDVTGALLCVGGLGLPVYALIEQARYGWGSPLIYGSFVLGVATFAAFMWWERRASHPMLDLSLFTVRNFSFGNIATVSIYGGLSVATFLISIFLQQVGHYKAITAGLALVPVTIIMFFLSSRFGALSGKYGPRLFMTAGPLLAAAGFLAMLRVQIPLHYWSQLFPAIVLFGTGLSMTVSPLTSAVLGAVNEQRSGIASAINNAISRVAGLIAIAALGILIGSKVTLHGFHAGVAAAAALLAIGGVTAYVGIRNQPAGGIIK